MKTKFQIKNLLLLMAIFTFFNANSQTDCKPYIPNNKGDKWEITNYNAKDKLEGKTVYELIEKQENSNGITFKIRMISFDKKGEEIYNNTSSAYCKNGSFQFDMSFFMNAETMQSYEGMNVDVDASDFELPNFEASNGTKLKDANLNMKVTNNGIPMLNMNIDITERMMEKREDMSTAAGKFPCIVIYQKINTKMIVKVTSYSREWYSQNVGMIRSESYNSKGKLMGYSELTKLDI